MVKKLIVVIMVVVILFTVVSADEVAIPDRPLFSTQKAYYFVWHDHTTNTIYWYEADRLVNIITEQVIDIVKYRMPLEYSVDYVNYATKVGDGNWIINLNNGKTTTTTYSPILAQYDTVTTEYTRHMLASSNDLYMQDGTTVFFSLPIPPFLPATYAEAQNILPTNTIVLLVGLGILMISLVLSPGLLRRVLAIFLLQ